MSFARFVSCLFCCIYLSLFSIEGDYKNAQDLAFLLEQTQKLSKLSKSDYTLLKQSFKEAFPETPLLERINQFELVIEYNQMTNDFEKKVMQGKVEHVKTFLHWSLKQTNFSGLERVIVDFPQWKPKSSAYIHQYKKLLFKKIALAPKEWSAVFTNVGASTNYLNPAWYLYKIGYYAQAESLLKMPEVIEHGRFYYLGVIKYKQQNYREAAKFLRTYLKKNPIYEKDTAKIGHWAWYYYYLSLEKLNRQVEIYSNLKRFCKKNPSEKYYRILLRVVAKAKPSEREIVRRDFFQAFPRSYTTYLENRKKAFQALGKDQREGIRLLKKAYTSRPLDHRLARSVYLSTNALGEDQHLFLDGFMMSFLDGNGDALPWANPGWKKSPFYSTNDRQKILVLSQEDEFYSNFFQVMPNDFEKYLQGRAMLFAQAGYQQEIFDEIEKRFKPWDAFYLKKEIHLRKGEYSQLARLAYGHVKKNFERLPHSFLKLAYPKPYQNYVEMLGDRKGIEPHLIFAVIRAESNYRPDAVSWAGAKGLMQIMPRTGGMLYKVYPLRNLQPLDLLRPEQNIFLGTTYLSDLSRQFGSEKILMLAAYNGGGGNVRKWNKAFKLLLPKAHNEKSAFGFKKTPSGVGWLDYALRIPFDETERYVQKVIRNLHIYNVLYQKK